MSQTLSDKTKALILALLIITSSVIVAWFSSGWQLALLIAAVQLAVVWAAKPIWMSDKSNFLLRGVTLAIVSGVVLVGNAWWQPFVQSIVHQYFPNVPVPDYSVSPVTLLFLLVLVTIVFRYTKTESVIEKPEKKITDLFEGPTIKQKWESICESLGYQIRDIDTATNWSHEYYTPLDAEVEMKTSSGTRKVVKDLLEAIKESNDRLFLLIGDPCAGKSVALRKLCLDILKESVKREYIPIYVNLKEWTTKSDWTKTPPTSKDLEAFVKQNLLNPKDSHFNSFFEQYYNILDENGNLFFVLDSFDEIPQVLGTTAGSKLIEDVSIVCREFLLGAKQKRSKGILASREYRMPREEYFRATTTLRVRPFSFEKIENSLTQSGKISKATVEQLLRERPELVPNLRNPFITSLLKAYLADNNNRFPKNQADLFQNYIHTSIKKAQARSGHEDLSLDDILSVTTQIAKIIFSEGRLQAPLSMLRQKVTYPYFDAIIEILHDQRIVRNDTGNTTQFSFTHRRFYEYFVVQDLLKKGKNDLPLKNIPTDSLWRDTLVLYCEVAPFEEAQQIANYCWFEVIQPKNNISDYASKHCLRFLTEAFRGRQECLVDFYQDLADYIINAIRDNSDMPNVKFASECIGILDKKNLDIAAISALSYNNSWINENTIRACRHLDTISTDLENSLIHVIDAEKDFFSVEPFDFKAFIKIDMSDSELIWSLSLSEAFKNVKMRLDWQITNDKLNTNLAFSLFFLTLFLYITLPPFESLTIQNIIQFGPKEFKLFTSVIVSTIILFLLKAILNELILKLYYKELIKLKTSFNVPLKIVKSLKQVYPLPLIVAIIMVLVAFLVVMREMGNSKIAYFSALILGLLFATYIFAVIFSIIKDKFFYIKNRYFLKNINKHKCNQREYIYWVFINLSNNPDSTTGKFLDYLETNIKIAYGKWPDEQFLKINNHERFIRLAKLEERWREAEERAAESQNKPVAPTPKTAASAKTVLQNLVRDGQLTAALDFAATQKALPKETALALVLLQARLSHLENERTAGTLENASYNAQLTKIAKDFLAIIEELEI